MPRTTSALPPRLRSSVRAHLVTSGNGTPPDASPSNRLVRIEVLLESIEKSLAVQFQRISELQAQLDRAIADRPLTRPR